MYGGGTRELGVGRGQIELLAALSTPTCPTTWRRAPTTRTTRRAACPASLLAPRPAATGFRWTA